MGQASKPATETEVALTLVGMHHSKVLRPLVDVFFEVVELMLARRRTMRPSRREPRNLVITDQDVKQMLTHERRLDTEAWPLLLYKLMEREPFFSSNSSLTPNNTWTKGVPREVDAYDGVRTIEEYIVQLERLTAFVEAPVAPSTPSPLDLVAALDYLDAVWRVAHQRHLFAYPSAERVAKLVFRANTTEEFDSRLSGLGEILRSANASAKTVAGGKLAASTRADPLAPLEDMLVRTVDATAEVRVRKAVTDLEHALAIRDAAQHAEAGDRAVRALDALAIGHPIADVGLAWSMITARVIEALGAIREELAAASP